MLCYAPNCNFLLHYSNPREYIKKMANVWCVSERAREVERAEGARDLTESKAHKSTFNFFFNQQAGRWWGGGGGGGGQAIQWTLTIKGSVTNKKLRNNGTALFPLLLPRLLLGYYHFNVPTRMSPWRLMLHFHPRALHHHHHPLTAAAASTRLQFMVRYREQCSSSFKSCYF